MKEITKMTALALGQMIKKKEIKVSEAVLAQLEAIKQREPSYHCYITVLEEEALQMAKKVQEQIDAGLLEDSPLAGVPVAIKDNICTKGIKTTCASKMLADYVPGYDATVIERLKAGGAIIIGKSNMDEFSMGSTTETSYYGATKNPWDKERVPGGSSGGSAAAVAAGEAFFALASDTGGSIRQPAAYCGVIGLKPTYGTVSRYGLIAYASSLDQIGTMGKSVSDCASSLELISGYDPKDSTSIKESHFQYRDALVEGLKGMKIGVPKGIWKAGLDPEIAHAIQEAIGLFRSMGAHIEEFEMEFMEYAGSSYNIIACAEASSNLSRYDGVKYGFRSMEYEDLEDLYIKTRSKAFGEEVKRRIMLGTLVLSSDYYESYYKKALKVRSLINRSFQKAFEKCDILLTPTTPTTAPKLGTSLSDPLKMYHTETYNVAINLAGLPALSIPCGLDSKGLPMGLQLIGKHFGEKDIIRAAYNFEQSGSLVSNGNEFQGKSRRYQYEAL